MYRTAALPDVDDLSREAADRHVPGDEELARRLDRPVPWERVVVMGDSIAQGLREPVPGYRDLSWAQRLAAAFTLARPRAVVFNLARRDLTASEIRASQLDAALGLGPELVVVTAGGNDALRRDWDPGRVADELRATLQPLRAAGADTLTMDLFDTTHNPYVAPRRARPFAARIAELVEVTRAVSAELGGWHARLRDHPAAADADIYARDGLHLNARGHGIVADALARRLQTARGD
jgi:lysophospholipase L1-like esterase